MAAGVSQHGMWSSKLGFVLAAVGSAVGLGNIWRFSYVTAENGGGAFVLVYLLAVLSVGLPLMIAEVMIGRAGRESPINTLIDLARESRASPAWSLIGWSGIVAGLLILSFYCVIAGWTLSYTVTYAQAVFSTTPAISDPGAHFGALTSSTSSLLFWHFVFIVLTIGVVARGVEKGIEAAVRFMIPSLFLILVSLVIYGATTGHFSAALSYMFAPDFGKVTGSTLVAALGQAFFSLSLGMAGMMAYGAYVPDKASIPRLAGIICIADTGVALLAGMAIFPLVFAFSLDPHTAGPGLVFVALPSAFSRRCSSAMSTDWPSSCCWLLPPGVRPFPSSRAAPPIWSSADSVAGWQRRCSAASPARSASAACSASPCGQKCGWPIATSSISPTSLPVI